eukprot:scaffold19845_cov17-Prasinocladus_malaysianus.AAC.1
MCHDVFTPGQCLCRCEGSLWAGCSRSAVALAKARGLSVESGGHKRPDDLWATRAGVEATTCWIIGSAELI